MISICDTINLNAKKKALLNRFFEKPVPTSIKWKEAIGLLKACGAQVDEKKGKTSGGRTIATLKGNVLSLHRPHPGNEIKQYVVRVIAEFLTKTGVAHVKHD